MKSKNEENKHIFALDIQSAAKISFYLTIFQIGIFNVY